MHGKRSKEVGRDRERERVMRATDGIKAGG